MPSRVYVKLNGVSRPHKIEHGVSVHLKNGNWEIKDASGEIIGWYKKAKVDGWSIESEPADVKGENAGKDKITD